MVSKLVWTIDNAFEWKNSRNYARIWRIEFTVVMSNILVTNRTANKHVYNHESTIISH